MKYNIDWVQEKVKKEKLVFDFFWSHQDKKDEGVGSFCFSQWYESPFVVNDINYKTAEHWMMSKKSLFANDVASHLQVLESDSPRSAKKIGRKLPNHDNKKWYQPSYRVVVAGNIHKFNQHPELLAHLLGTKQKVLVEASPFDQKWGIGLRATDENARDVFQWQGTNFLGFALMEVRDFFLDFGRFDYPEFMLIPPCDLFKNYDNQSDFWQTKEAIDYTAKFNVFHAALNQQEKRIYDICYPFQ